MPTEPHPVLKQYYQRDGDRPSFVTALFDGSAGHYDRVCQLISLGSGQWYRRWALGRAGLRPGMTLLDVATGTGLVARAATRILGDGNAVTGVDPSAGMLREARSHLAGPLVQSRVEDLPFADGSFDFACIGYALRHAADLDVACRECSRVLRPAGRLLILEISRPRSGAARRLIRTYFTRVLPALMSPSRRSAQVRTLMHYYWDTIEACVPPQVILDVLHRAGFAQVERRVLGGLLSEYLALKSR